MSCQCQPVDGVNFCDTWGCQCFPDLLAFDITLFCGNQMIRRTHPLGDRIAELQWTTDRSDLENAELQWLLDKKNGTGAKPGGM